MGWLRASGSSPALRSNVRADVCVVGAGIAGLTTAYLLAAEGRSVVVLDDGPIGGGMTGATTAHLASALDDRFIEIERLHGEAGASSPPRATPRRSTASRTIVRDEQIDCDFERLDGYLFAAAGTASRRCSTRARGGPAGGPRRRRDGRRARRSRVRHRALPPLPPPGPVPSADVPGRPGRGRSGGAAARIFTRQPTPTAIEGGSAGPRPPPATATSRPTAVVVATNTPVNDRVAIHTKQAPYLTYVIGARVPRGSVPRGLYWDTDDPYHYVRLQRSCRTASATA